MAAGSLVVKIGADIGDFSKKLNRLTKDVREAGETIGEIGKAMTLGITVPVGLALGALAKMAAENEQVGNKMGRVFADRTADMQEAIDKMMPSVDEAGTALQQFAIKAAELGDDLGMGARQSTAFAQGMMQMAGAIAASKAVPFAEAMDAVQSAMKGKTKALGALNIGMKEYQVQTEAVRLGLAKQKQELTPLGTALATYSLLLQKTKGMSGEAAARAVEVGRGFAFVKRDLAEFADATSMLLLPALRAIAGTLKALVQGLNELPQWVRASTITLAVMAATIGPMIWLVSKLAVAFTVLSTAIKLVAAGDALAKFLAFVKNPAVIIGIVALGAVIGGLTWAYSKFRKEAEKPVEMDFGLPPDLQALLGNGSPTATAKPTKPADLGPTFNDRAGALFTGFEQNLAMGDGVIWFFDQINDLGAEAVRIYAEQADKLGDVALAAQRVLQQSREIAAIKSVGSSMFGPASDATAAVRSASQSLTPPGAMNWQVAQQKIGEETQLRFREAMLRTTNTFDAVRVAALELGERFRRVKEDFGVALANLKKGYSSAGSFGTEAMMGLQAGVTGVLQQFTPFGLAIMAVGRIMEGLQPVLDAVSEPLVVLGKIVGIMLTPVLRLLFVPLKYLGIAVALVGEVINRVVGAIYSGIGKLLIGIGNLLNKLPGSIGNPLKRAGQAMLDVAGIQYETADQLKRTRKDLQGMQFGDTADSIGRLGDAANTASEALTNLPQAFKYALRKFQATDAIGVATGDVLGARDNAPVAQINLDGRQIAQITWGHIRSAAARQFNDPLRVADVAVVGG